MNNFISVLSSITIGLTSVTQVASSKIQLVNQKSNVVCLQTIKKPLQMDISNYDATVKTIFDFDIKPFRDAKVWTESYNAVWKFWNSGLKNFFNK